MEPETSSPAPHRSLIVRLRYKPLCERCTSTLPHWEEPSYAWGGDEETWWHDHLFDDPYTRAPLWICQISRLRIDSLKCSCCKFIIDALEASPWMAYEEMDYIRITSHLVGSQHSSPYLREWIRWAESNYGEQPRETGWATEYKKYYRPRLQVIKEGSEWDRRGQPQFGPSYSLRSSLFLFPMTPIASPDVSMFCGRIVGTYVDYTLIKAWFKTCNHKHRQDSINSRHDFPYRNFFKDLDTNEKGCSPHPFVPPPSFRLVDTTSRCVVKAGIAVDYAALSYVWGDADRLMLCKDNEVWLTTSGVLSRDNERVPQTFRDALDVAESLSIRYLWIDSLCIRQDDADEMQKQMDTMDSIYGAAVLTIVNDTSSAGSGIKGVSIPRQLNQAVFSHGSKSYVSMKKTFGEALRDSPWESRAWCLQEKVFSKRLLVFTDTQTFFHCKAATWFEDTVLEEQEEVHIPGAVHMRERPLVTSKLQPPRHARYTAYETHQQSFERNFWTLARIFSQRSLAYESDAIRAFGGILKSVEPDRGLAIWSIPQYDFVQGLTWSHTQHQLSLRRTGFPSWTWAGWSATSANPLNFENCKRTDADNRFFNGIYYIRQDRDSGPSAWDIEWHHYSNHHDDSSYVLTKIARKAENRKSPSSLDDSLYLPNLVGAAVGYASMLYRPNRLKTNIGTILEGHHTWRLLDHPYKGKDRITYTRQYTSILEKYADWFCQAEPEFPSFVYQLDTMPCLSHIIRFYTSVATLYVEPEPTPKLPRLWPRRHTSYDYAQPRNLHRVILASTGTVIGHVQLDAEWSGKGHEHSVIYISRWCNDMCEDEHDLPGVIEAPEQLNLLLIESVPGWGEVKQRVQMLELVDIVTWRKAKPRWELVNLA